jgi:hypothetical protein
LSLGPRALFAVGFLKGPDVLVVEEVPGIEAAVVQQPPEEFHFGGQVSFPEAASVRVGLLVLMKQAVSLSGGEGFIMGE